MTRDDKGHSSGSSHEHSLYLHNGRITEGERKGNGRKVKMASPRRIGIFITSYIYIERERERERERWKYT